MPENQRQKARALFLTLADLPAAEQGPELARACGQDAALQAEVEALLRADRAAGSFLASPTGAGAAQRSDRGSEDAREAAGATIGRYKLLEQIGEGGMGTIWMAEQREPVKRRVALKIIKLGMDTRQVIARFEAERQALALMDHPHIAKVLDAGATETGRPYFVMEYIKGIPILEYCDQEKLDTQARLELFASVCHAIQHAHHKGIIHRDIKPSNVLVTLHDGVPVPKVIDFGIAKATNAELTTKTLFTEHRQMVGTPAYMSPEQAEMSGLDIDTRSDIYSLGVLLYELLTGTTPFDTQELMAHGYAEMMRTIREVEPHKPSTRISTLGETGARTAQQRHVDLEQLGSLLRGDIDWIVMKCLEKDRTLRYETANGLAADIVRHLRDEPVTAGAQSKSYKLRKFVKRNRGQVIAVGIVAALLVLGVIGTTGGMIWANHERDRAEAESTKATLAADSEAKARVEAQASATRAIEEAQRAEALAEAEGKARKRLESISQFVVAALESSDAQNLGGGQDKTILAAMEDAISDIDAGRFAEDAELEMTLRSMIGIIQMNNGQAARSELQAAKVLALCERVHPGDHDEVVGALINLAQTQVELGRSKEAEPLCRRALAMSERLGGPDSLRVANVLHELAVVLNELGRPEEAEQASARSVELHRLHFPGDHVDLAQAISVLGQQRHALGQFDEAERAYFEALEMFQRLHEGDHPNLAKELNNVAMIQRDLGHFEQADASMRRSLEMYERIYAGDHPHVARGLSNLSFVQQALGRSEEADGSAQRAVDMYRRLFPGDHLAKAIALECLSDSREVLGRMGEAEALQRESTAMFERLYDSEHPDVLRSQGLLALHLWTANQFDRSIALFEEVVRKQERVLGPENSSMLINVGNLGVALRDAGRPAEAQPLLERAYRGLRSTELWFGEVLFDEYRRRALAGEPGFHEKAADLLRDRLVDARAVNAAGSLELANKLGEYGKGLLDLEAWTEAEVLLRECLAIRERGAPDTWSLFNAKAMLGGALQGRGELTEAEALLLEGIGGMIAREASIPPQGKPRIGEAIERLARLYAATGNTAEAAAWRSRLAEHQARSDK